MLENTYKTRLPWILGLVFFVLYAITLNRWVAVGTVASVAPIMGWNFWSLQLQYPLYQLVTLPFRYMPQTLAIPGLNLLNAVLATMTIVWLARSVMLLPQDRSTDQRVRVEDPDGLYTTKMAIVPPIIAASSLGLLFNFWLGAIESTPQILNVCLLAYIVRNTLEHRLDGEESWVYRASAVYSLALVNNWLMVWLLPIWVFSLIWINGKNFMEYSHLIIRSICWFLPGLLLFFYAPIVETISGGSGLSFFDLLRSSLSNYYGMVTGLPLYMLLLFSTFSLCPLLFLSISWDGSHRGQIGANVMMTRIGVRAMNLFFFVYTIAVAFDLPISPRQLGGGYAGLEFHFFAALSLGYSAGYLLVVFFEQVLSDSRTRYRVSGIMNVLRPVVTVFTLLAGVAMIGGLLYLNYPQIRANNGDTLYKLGSSLVADLQKAPDNNRAVAVFSDDPIVLFLTRATMARQGVDVSRYIFVDTRYLSYPWYHKQMRGHYGDLWEDHFSAYAAEQPFIVPENISQWMFWFAQRTDIYYLHPSFGHFFEACKPTNLGLLTRMTTYKSSDVSIWVLSEEELAALDAYWNEKIQSKLPVMKPDEKRLTGSEKYAAAFYSRALNEAACEFAKAGNNQKAVELASKAVELFPENLSAFLNLRYYQTGSEALSEDDQRTAARLFVDNGSSLQSVVLSCGHIDVPSKMFEFGKVVSYNRQWRQAFQYFLRVQQLEPDNLNNLVALAYTDSMIGESEHALELIRLAKQKLKEKQNVEGSEATALDIQEAACLISTGKTNEALALLQEAYKNYPQDANISQMLIRIYIAQNEFEKALALVDRLLAVSPDNVDIALQKAYCLYGLERNNEALTIVDQLLRKMPLDTRIHFLRGDIMVALKNYPEALSSYQTVYAQDPDNITTMINIASVKKEMGNKEDYLKWCNAIITNKYCPPETVKAIKEEMEKAE